LPSDIYYNLSEHAWADGTSFPSATPSRIGYTFNAWNTAADGSGNTVNNLADIGTVTGNKTIYATWTVDVTAEEPPNSGIFVWATVNFNENGGTAGTSPSDILYNLSEHAWADGTTFPSGEPARVGYEFDSWNTAADDSGDEVTSLTTIGTITGNKTIYAQWTVDEDAEYPPGSGNSVWATVDFNANGGAINSVPTPILYNLVAHAWADGITFPTTIPTRLGYDFAGWNKAADGSGNTISNLANIGNVTGNITIYAQWTVDTTDPSNWATVDFDGNGVAGSTITGLPSSLSYNLSEHAWVDGTTFPTATPSRIGYTFSGWNLTPAGTGTPVTDLAGIGTITGNKTIYAQWTVDQTAEYPPNSGNLVWVTVDFSENGGTAGTSPSDIYYNLSEHAWADGTTFPSGEPARPGYDFGSWNTTADGNGDEVTNLATIGTVTEDKTIYAQWTIDEDAEYPPGSGNLIWATVNFDANGGNASSAPADLFYNLLEQAWADGTTFPTTQPTRSGYGFAGWNTVQNGSGSVVSNLSDISTITGNTTIYAQWSTDNYAIGYMLNGGTNAAGNPTSYNVNGSFPIHIANPTKDGYTFAGWTAAGGISIIAASTSVTIPSGTTGDIAFVANWTQKTYTVAFSPGAHGNFNVQVTHDLHYGDATPTAPTVVGYSGYTFTGWSPVVDSTVTGNVTYTAQWSGTGVTPPDPNDNSGGGNNSGGDNSGGGGNSGGDNNSGGGDNSGGGNNSGGNDNSGDGNNTDGGSNSGTGNNPGGTDNVGSGGNTDSGNTGNSGSGGNTNSGNNSGNNPPTINRPATNATPPAVIITEPVIQISEVAVKNGTSTELTDTVKLPKPPKDSGASNQKFDGFSIKDVQRLESQSGNVITDLLDGNVPRGFAKAKGVWGFSNLIIAVLAFALAVTTILRSIAKRKQLYFSKTTYILRTASIICGLVAVIVWLVVEQITAQVVWINQWTVPLAILFSAQVVIMAVHNILSTASNQKQMQMHD
jgi:uncharacterized repeat protein (TIGR02543 family)